MKVVFEQLNDWFNVNLLLPNSEKTRFVHFNTKNACEINGKLQYENKFNANLSDTKFVGLWLNNTMYWRVNINHLIPKLSSAWYAIRTLKQIMSQETLTFRHRASSV